MFDPREVGRRIQERRKQKRLTREQLAQAVCISVQAVSRWENGESMPNIGTFPALCKTLGASADARMGNHPTSNPVHPVHMYLLPRKSATIVLPTRRMERNLGAF